MTQGYVLHGAVRSSAAWRARIALHLKGVAFREIHLDLHAGDQRQADYLKTNPEGLVPALALPGGRIVTQSLAIIEYLDEVHPQPPLLPADAFGRARVRALAQIVACDIHPINNLRVRNHVRALAGGDEAAQAEWMAKWGGAGFDALEARLRDDSATGRFCHGDAPTLADCCLVPQVGNARAMGRPVDDWPTIVRIADACAELPAFRAANLR